MTWIAIGGWLLCAALAWVMGVRCGLYYDGSPGLSSVALLVCLALAPIAFVINLFFFIDAPLRRVANRIRGKDS